MAEDTFDSKMRSQAGRCALCGDPPGGKRRLHHDHCHATGFDRGLLCARCNMGLGMFRDRPDLLRAAAAYLERHAARVPVAPKPRFPVRDFPPERLEPALALVSRRPS
jgi:hypothetical protein